MNKFDCITKVNLSNLSPANKLLLIELIVRANDDWECWPSVQRLCMVRGIKHEKNFKGAEYYLPGLVTKFRNGRKNHYRINIPALEELSEAEVIIKHTPVTEGVNTPAPAENAPAVGEHTPAAGGANSTNKTTKKSTDNNTTVAYAPVDVESSPRVGLGELPSTIPNLEEIEDVEVIWDVDEVPLTSSSRDAVPPLSREQILAASIYTNENELRERRRRILGKPSPR